MSFSVDKQTLDDLNIFTKKGRDSVFGLFNRTRTRGGAELLEQIFRYPLSDAAAINHRIDIIRSFQQVQLTFPFKEEWFDIIEQYLGNADERSQLSHDDNKLGRTFNSLIGADSAFKQIARGVEAVHQFLQAFGAFTGQVKASLPATGYATEVATIDQLLQIPPLTQFTAEKDVQKLSYEKTAQFDRLLRFQQKELLQKLLSHAYLLDVYIAVAGVAAARKFVFPVAVSEELRLKLEGVYHPLVENAVGNDIRVTADNNMIFLTGANMAGKSTFMKTMGIALFLAHAGFPVPASHMEFPVLDGMFSTINLPDNLSMGYSHFYAEVLRVKRVAEQLAASKKLFVIFDELFRGTNVKDAYEATVALTAAFARKKDSIFLISTHIIEAGDELKQQCNNIYFTYLPTRMEGQKLVYTYTLEEGITEDRHGMIIVQNEGIIDILRIQNSNR